MLEGLFDPSHITAAEEELKFVKDNHINYHYFLDTQYPEKLKHWIDGPILLFQLGNINLEDKKIISIVGTRKITTNGIAFCEK